MCRAISEGGRRCPCDTSAARVARRERRGNETLTKKHAGNLSKRHETVTVPPTPSSDVDVVVAETKAKIRELHADTVFDSPIAAEQHQLALIRDIGENVEYIAETKYDAPTDEDMLAVAYNDDEWETKRKAFYDEHTRIGNELDAYRKTVGSVAKLPDGTLVRGLGSKITDDELAHFQSLYDQMHEASEAHNAMVKAGRPLNQEWYDISERRANAMKQALEDVGVEFTDPTTLQYADNSNKKATAALREAVTFYPQEWVDASNQDHAKGITELTVKQTRARAHYAHGKLQSKNKRVPQTYTTTREASWEPRPGSLEAQEYTLADPQPDHLRPGRRAWKQTSYQYKHQEPGPRQRGWERVTYQNYDGEETVAWRKPRMRNEFVDLTQIAELTVSVRPAEDGNRTPGFSCALHEMAHRIEATHPTVTTYEHAFLNDRARTHSANPEKPTTISGQGKSREIGIKDNFTHHYMGRIYPDKSREILSTGMEAVFCGAFGGFAGAGKNKPDTDYKRFILGTIASTAKK